MPPTNKTSVMLREEFREDGVFECDLGDTDYKKAADEISDWWLAKFDSLISTIESEVKTERVEDGEAMFANDPKNELSEGYTIGYNQALSDVLAIINNAKK